ALFTAGAQVDHLMRVAGELGLRDAVLETGRTVLVASIGPVCSEALHRHGLAPDLEPEHPKMGHLVVAVARHFGRRVAAGPVSGGPEPVVAARPAAGP
nr:uroporphyrinogen-III synthase [Actinomycetota bacterium]